jgi:hypothetical protein
MQIWPVAQPKTQLPKNFLDAIRQQPITPMSSATAPIATPAWEAPTMPSFTQPTAEPFKITPLQNLWWPVMPWSQMWWFPQDVNVRWLLDKVISSGKATKSQLDVLMWQIKDKEKARRLLTDLESQWVTFEIPEPKKTTAETFAATKKQVEDVTKTLRMPEIWRVWWLALDVAEWVVNLASSIPDIYKNRARKWQDAILAMDQNFWQSLYQTLLQWVWVWVDITWEAFAQWLWVLDKQTNKVISNSIMSFMNSPRWQEIAEQISELRGRYNELAEANPIDARNLDAWMVAIELLLEAVWAWGVKQAWKAGTRALWTTFKWLTTEAPTLWRVLETPQVRPALERLGKPEYLWQARIVNSIESQIWFTDKLIASATWLDPRTVSNARNNKSLIILWDLQGWDRESTVQHVLDNIESAIERYSEWGQAYQAIRESGNVIESMPIQQRVADYLNKNGIGVAVTTRWTTDTFDLTFKPTTKFTAAEQNLLREAILPILDIEDVIIWADEFLNVRTRLTKAAAFDRNVTKWKDATDYIKWLRKEVNDVAKWAIPWLKEADDIYSNIVDEVSNVASIFFKDWTQSTNVFNKVRSILREPASSKTKQALLRAVPDIEDRMLYMDIANDIARTSWTQKTWTYITAILWWILWMSWWPIWSIMWTLLWFYIQTPDLMKSLLIRWWTPQQAAEAIAKKLSRQEALLNSEKRLIQDAIQKASELPPAMPETPTIPPLWPQTPPTWWIPPMSSIPNRWWTPVMTAGWFPEFVQWPSSTARQQQVIADQARRLRWETAENLTSAPQTSIMDETLSTTQWGMETPKTIKLWIKSKFSSEGSYKDIPVIRRENNITLYQWWTDPNQQFWTSNKKYAESFWKVKEKTGDFFLVDNWNRMTDVYVEANKVVDNVPTTQWVASPTKQAVNTTERSNIAELKALIKKNKDMKSQPVTFDLADELELYNNKKDFFKENIGNILVEWDNKIKIKWVQWKTIMWEWNWEPIELDMETFIADPAGIRIEQPAISKKRAEQMKKKLQEKNKIIKDLEKKAENYYWEQAMYDALDRDYEIMLKSVDPEWYAEYKSKMESSILRSASKWQYESKLLEDYRKKIESLNSREKRIWMVWRQRVWKQAKEKQSMDWLKRKEKIITELWEDFNLDQFEAMDLFEELQK